MSYDEETKQAYVSKEAAAQYQSYYQDGISWMKFTMKREASNVDQLLDICEAESSPLLDMPCGAGVMAPILSKRGITSAAGDISHEMIKLAEEISYGPSFAGYFQGDATNLPFRDEAFNSVLTIGLLHRLPPEIRRLVLSELNRVTRKWLIASFSLSSPAQAVKHQLCKVLWPERKGAPAPISKSQLLSEVHEAGFSVQKELQTFPVLSSSSIFLLRKESAT